MKHSPLTMVLMGLVAASAVVSIVLCMLYATNSRELRALTTKLQLEITAMNNDRVRANALLNDVLEYSKKNPSIDPVLQSIGINPNALPPSAGKSK